MNHKMFIEKFKSSGMLRHELAKKSSVHFRTISRLVAGEQLNITGDTIRALEKALQLKKGSLL